MANTTLPITLKASSFESIREDLLRWSRSRPNGELWSDYFEHSDGAIVLEWIAGLAAFINHRELTGVRERYLDTARLTSSVFELAFHKGLLIPPAYAAEYEITLYSDRDLTLHKGARIGSLSMYGLYVKELAFVPARTPKLVTVIVGNELKVTKTFPNMTPFLELRYFPPHTYMAQQLESFVDNATGLEIPLQTEPQYLSEVRNNFILRRVLPGEVRIYTGNGVLGWTNPNSSSVTYTVYSYDENLQDLMVETPRSELTGVAFQNIVLTKRPSFNPSREEVRAIARYYPLDGRVVNDADYEAIILKMFGGKVLDVYSYNSDPEQEIYLLKDVNFGDDELETDTLNDIQRFLDAKRAMGMRVNYHLREPNEGLTWQTTYTVPYEQLNSALIDQVNQFTTSLLFKFQRKAGTLTSFNIALEMAARFGASFIPNNPNYAVNFQPEDFFKSIIVNLVPGG